jgi:hypothetical protein
MARISGSVRYKFVGYKQLLNRAVSFCNLNLRKLISRAEKEWDMGILM